MEKNLDAVVAWARNFIDADSDALESNSAQCAGFPRRGSYHYRVYNASRRSPYRGGTSNSPNQLGIASANAAPWAFLSCEALYVNHEPTFGT